MDQSNHPNDIEAKAAQAGRELIAIQEDLLAQHEHRYKEFLISSKEIEKITQAKHFDQILEVLLGLAELEDYVLK